MNGPSNSFQKLCASQKSAYKELLLGSRTASALEGKESPPRTSGGTFTSRESARSNVTAETSNV